VKICAVEDCDIAADLQAWVNDDAGNRLIDEPRCMDHFIELLRFHPDKEIPWPIYGPASLTPWRYILASEALRLMGLEFA